MTSPPKRVSREAAMSNNNAPKRVSLEEATNHSYKKNLEDMTAFDFREIATKIKQHQSLQHLQSIKNQVKFVLQLILETAERGEFVTTYNPDQLLMKEAIEILTQKHQITMEIGTKTGKGTTYTMSIKADDSPFYP